MSEFILYSYFRSSASHRVRIALNLKNVGFEYRAIHLLNNGGEQFSKEYRDLNPSRQVPTLIHNGLVLGQSIAIIEYLDRIRPKPSLFPEDPFRRALVVQACEIVNSGIQPLQNVNVLTTLEKMFGADQTKKNDWCGQFIKAGLEGLEKFLKPHAGDYCFGNQLSAADCFLIPQLVSADRFRIPLANYPTLAGIRANCDGLDAFRKSAPNVQPDTPADA